MILNNLTVLPGGGRPAVGADVHLDDHGVVSAIEPSTAGPDWLVPSAVDLHLDNLLERRQPRATVNLDLPGVISSLDAECAANGVGLVCIAARCEETPGKGIHAADAIEMAELINQLASGLACEWRIHARVEITDAIAIDTLERVLEISEHMALVSMMEHTLEKSRFADAQAHREFYAKDWGLPVDEVDRILASKRIDEQTRTERRAQVAELAHAAAVPLASHDDRSAEAVESGAALGAAISEFPLSFEAADRAGELGMLRVLGAPNAVRGRSTSPGNILVADAVRAGRVDALCSDYLPSALLQAPFSLAAQEVIPADQGIDLVSANPARAIGSAVGHIEVGQPLTASLVRPGAGHLVGRRMWRDGRLVFTRA